jgi:hypothetical protein
MIVVLGWGSVGLAGRKIRRRPSRSTLPRLSSPGLTWLDLAIHLHAKKMDSRISARE